MATRPPPPHLVQDRPFVNQLDQVRAHVRVSKIIEAEPGPRVSRKLVHLLLAVFDARARFSKAGMTASEIAEIGWIVTIEDAE